MGPSIWQLLIIVLIIVLLFGTKKLKNLGSDLGGALKGFKSSMSDEEKKAEEAGRVIEGEVDEQHDTEKTADTTKDKEKTS